VRYRVELSDAALRGLRQVPEPTRSRMAKVLASLADDPYPPGSKLLQGPHKGRRRVRVSDYRAIYEVDETFRVVAIARIGNRRNVYNK
jgi:mRNA interferase RelE/StbE